MGRKAAASGMSSGGFTKYASLKASEDGLGLGNFGETDRWMGSIDSDEEAAVDDYSGDAYKWLNKALRKDVPFDSDPDDEGYDPDFDYESIDKNLESALNKFTLEKPTEFVRGASASLLGGAKSVDDINKMAGSFVRDAGYMSSSATASASFDAPVKYHIKTPAGTGIGAYIKGFSQYPSENEFLFNKGSAFRIDGAYQDATGQIHCNLTYVGRT